MKKLAGKLTSMFYNEYENEKLFFIFHKALGIVYLFALFPLFFQIQQLIGTDGLMPAKTLLKEAYRDQGVLKSFMQFPSLFHIYPYPLTLYLLIGIGCIGALLLFFTNRIFIGALLSWLSFLSITTIGGDFFIIIIDLFLNEVGFLALLSSFYLQKYGTVPNLISFAFKLLNFRLWFCMGVNKFYLPNDVWSDLTFFDYFFQAQPMPTPLSLILNDTPIILKKLAIILLFISEIIIPFFVFGNKNFRLISFYTFLIVSILIQLSGNYGYFNLLSVVLALLVLHNDDISFTSKFKSKHSTSYMIPISIKTILTIQITLQLVYCIYIFNPKPYSSQNHFNYLFTTKSHKKEIIKNITLPFKWIEYWRICNPYGVFKGIPYKHAEIRISGSADSINWETYEFKFVPSGNTGYLGFYAPYYPRLDHLMFYETLAAQNYKSNPLNKFYTNKNTWISDFIKKLLTNDKELSKLLKLNPFINRSAPKYIKAELFQLSFDKNKNWNENPMNIAKVYTIQNPCTTDIINFEEAMKATYSK